mmetsp:Transcript_8467/g.17966  ORF Transcript_8467/g.17966 Transcript_8467/m.17966 type:complete len:129 (+) Transcript_8467:160-546(+)
MFINILSCLNLNLYSSPRIKLEIPHRVQEPSWSFSQCHAAPFLLEKSRNTSLRMDIENGLCKQRPNTKLHKLLISRSLWCTGNGVQNNALLQLGVGNPLISRSRQETVGSKCKYTSRPLRHKNVCSLA